MKKLSDPELLSLMREDSERAFSCLVERYSAVLTRHVTRRIKSEEDAMEILQDVFLSLWNKRFSIAVEESVYPYLFKAVKYETIDWMIKAEKQVARAQLLLLEAEPYEFPAEDVLIAQELNELLYAEVNKMPATMKTIFYMSRENSLSVKEIANALSLSEQTVKNNLSSALKRLRLTLSREHYLLVATGILCALR
ncbi:RNA polymerase sigma factor [Pedobacter sp. GR22-6]|uniref:RNA polymerase sigma factor n=1 Tax=Pedobacter sp. GR22-6 TaxID=3127957 RepID=UPI00307E7BA0